MSTLVYEGTWDQLMSHAEELKEAGNLRVTVLEAKTPPTKFKSPQEQIALLDALAEELQGSPHLPDSAFDRESLYA